MNTSQHRLLMATAVALFVAGCATVPPGPPPDVVRLENDLDRLHHDPRIADYAGTELGNADAAVDVLARNARALDEHGYAQGVYIADKLVRIAEASALAKRALILLERDASNAPPFTPLRAAQRSAAH